MGFGDYYKASFFQIRLERQTFRRRALKKWDCSYKMETVGNNELMHRNNNSGLFNLLFRPTTYQFLMHAHLRTCKVFLPRHADPGGGGGGANPP